MWQRAKNIYHLAQAFLAAVYFNFPSRQLSVIGVTGTDGKTTTTSMIYNALISLGQDAGMITSVGAVLMGSEKDTGLHVTTPNPWQIQKFLRDAKRSGAKYIALEATSHGLDQNRLAFIKFETAVLTNITHEHLDYHKTKDNYLKAKTKLFKMARNSVLNYDDPASRKIEEQVNGKIYYYSYKNSKVALTFPKSGLNLKIKGQYNQYNALAAYSALQTLGFESNEVKKALEGFEGVKGRYEIVDHGQNFTAIVDFAHTPNALKSILQTLKSDLKPGKRLIALFGAAGGRDKAKRPLMGKVAAQFASIIILTSEDPRDEDPSKICQEIAIGLKGFGKHENKDFFIETDRRAAISLALNMVSSGDIVGFFGKGHEKSMNIKNVEYPWDEVKEIKTAIDNL